MDKQTSRQNRTQEEQEHHHLKTDPHVRSPKLADIILGGQDGLVNTLGVILGVAAASRDTRLVLAAGLAATFAESISMGAVAYTSRKAEHSHYESELERERRHIHHVPDVERDEIRQIFSEKGFEGKLLNRIVETITSNKDVWINVMMSEEHKLSPARHENILLTSFIVGFSAIVGSLIPLFPFIGLPIGSAIIWSLGLSAVTLFAVGAYKARVTIGHPFKSGVEMTIIGIVSALAGYAVGLLFQAPPPV